MRSALVQAAALAGAAAVLGAGIALPQDRGEWTLLAGGSMAGYLSPCGCVKPMTGGLRRKAAAFRGLGRPQSRTVIELGPLSGGLGRQQEMKAETAAEALGKAGAAAISLAEEDTRHGPALAAALDRLSGGKMVAGFQAESARRFAASGPLLVSSWDPRSQAMARRLGAPAVSEAESIGGLAAEAQLRGKAAVLMLEAGRTDAVRIAQEHPSLSLVLYRSASNPPLELERVGPVALATPGEKGKSILRLTFADGAFRRLRVVSLGPSIWDDDDASRIYRTYQRRVAEERLLDQIPRIPSKGFAGNRTCMSCHGKAAEVWKDSAHAKALDTLEKERADRDPDCTGCHVVGLDSTVGFRSRQQTPQLAHVGCESCHGPGLEHAKTAGKVKMGRAGERSCAKCHVPDHSPGFDFASYWSRIRH